MAQAGVNDPSRLDEALGVGADKVREWLLGTAVE
jgi:hypothetical protein